MHTCMRTYMPTGLLGHLAGSLLADEVECLLDFLLLTKSPLKLEGSTSAGELNGGISQLANAQERVALTLCELCEGSGRAALPPAVFDHLRASGASSVLVLLALLGAQAGAVRI